MIPTPKTIARRITRRRTLTDTFHDAMWVPADETAILAHLAAKTARLNDPWAAAIDTFGDHR